ncbi:MerR family transcriptional regulator [Chitinibacter fontanus]|uniref:MerR family transcriptional regulator n=1 Tax=Chitinibacter fontanus TaxID=1737446 RepID=A0A7D5Z9L6_9NEIS|nr:MerR family transcriptional regulator [Chitinibacter fontanus]QLI80406.1 MerR family transcriptional regulator [Chitinibacter fontanus]
MLTIGQMARCFGLTTKTLRHYDSIGLFRPTLTGSDNRYRYYRAEQIETLGRIVWLRRFGVALETIRSLVEQGVLNDAATMREFLQDHATTMAAEIAKQQQVLTQLKHYLTQEWSVAVMQTPLCVTFPAKRIIGMIWQGNDDESIPEMWQRFLLREHEIIRQNKSPDSYGVCQPLEDGNWRYIAGVSVDSQTAIPAGMVAVEIPARTYACVEHLGAVSTMQQTYQAAYQEWLPAAGMQIDLAIDFEYYDERFLGPTHPDSITKIYIPLKN